MEERRIVYLSRASRSLPENEVAALVEAAITRNAGCGITGLLLFDGRRFLQAIEGEVQQVRRIMDRIHRDTRHRSVQLIEDIAIPRRDFGNWSMAYRNVGPGRQHPHPHPFLTRIKSHMESIPDMRLRAAFIGFARLAQDPVEGSAD